MDLNEKVDNIILVLRDICYINIEGPNHMNESEMYNAYERILDKLSCEKPEQPNECEHLNFVPRRDLSWYCKDCGYDTLKEEAEEKLKEKYLSEEDKE